MLQPKLLSMMILFFTLSFINCETKREIFAENIRKIAQSIKMPQEAKNLVKNFDNKVTLLFNSLTLNQLKEAQSKYDLSDSLTLQIRTAHMPE